MKRIVSILMTVAMLLSMASLSVFADAAPDYTSIDSVEEYVEFAKAVDAGTYTNNADHKVNVDLDFTGYNAEDVVITNQVGDLALDFQGHTVSGIVREVTLADHGNVGLIVDNAGNYVEVLNVKIKDCKLVVNCPVNDKGYAPWAMVGGVIGRGDRAYTNKVDFENVTIELNGPGAVGLAYGERTYKCWWRGPDIAISTKNVVVKAPDAEGVGLIIGRMGDVDGDTISVTALNVTDTTITAKNEITATAYVGTGTPENYISLKDGVTPTVTLVDNATGYVESTPIFGDNVTVNTAEELLQYIAEANAATAENGDATAGKVLTIGADIDLAGKTWAPFTKWIGTLNGNGKTLSNISYTDNTTTSEVGLIANLIVHSADGSINGTIENLTLKNCTLTATAAEKVGGIVGMANRGSVKNCTVDGCTVSGGKHVGGVAGRISYPFENIGGVDYHYCTGNTVKNTTVSGTEKVGAVIGRIRSDGVTYVITGTVVENNTVTVNNGGKKGDVFGSAEAAVVVEDKTISTYADNGDLTKTETNPDYVEPPVSDDKPVQTEPAPDQTVDKPAETGDSVAAFALLTLISLAGIVFVSKKRG